MIHAASPSPATRETDTATTPMRSIRAGATESENASPYTNGMIQSAIRKKAAAAEAENAALMPMNFLKKVTPVSFSTNLGDPREEVEAE